MRYQEQIVRMTQKALDDVCRAALAVEPDKVDWTPGGEARSVLSQMQEIAMAGKWFLPIIRDREVPEFGGHAQREAVRLRKSYDSLEKCVDGARATTSDLCTAILEFPDEHLEHEMQVPFAGGAVMTMADLIAMHYWNTVYHLGQINQIQLLLGDKEMH
jgi:hypothetical protein